ncbi:unnamed protein product, partial [Ectocarpus sp. 13 AM-2016]
MPRWRWQGFISSSATLSWHRWPSGRPSEWPSRAATRPVSRKRWDGCTRCSPRRGTRRLAMCSE